MKVIYRDLIGGPDAATVALRFSRSSKLWERYLTAGGSLAPEYDPSDPMHEFYLADGTYELGAIPGDLVRQDVNFESLIEITRRRKSLEAAHLAIQEFRRQLFISSPKFP